MCSLLLNESVILLIVGFGQIRGNSKVVRPPGKPDSNLSDCISATFHVLNDGLRLGRVTLLTTLASSYLYWYLCL